MKVLFLDIDGVLNNDASFRQFGGYGREPAVNERPTALMLAWCPLAVARLRKIVTCTGCHIVICSNWRGYGVKARQKWQQIFACYHWPDAPVIDETPFHGSLSGRFDSRGSEVAAWLREHREVTRYVCLDDHPDWYDRNQIVVQTWEEQGLQAEQVERCIEILNRDRSV